MLYKTIVVYEISNIYKNIELYALVFCFVLFCFDLFVLFLCLFFAMKYCLFVLWLNCY